MLQGISFSDNDIRQANVSGENIPQRTDKAHLVPLTQFCNYAVWPSSLTKDKAHLVPLTQFCN